MRRLLVIAAAVLLSAGCTRRPMIEVFGETARIPVKIDWSDSGIGVDPDDPSGSGLVHRVSLRFYPHDGSPEFERYLEGNIFEGMIDVPPGRYSVIVMNETVGDDNYWGDFVTFHDTDDFYKSCAEITAMHRSTIDDLYPFYEPGDDEAVVVAPLSLASWSIEELVVTDDMVNVPEDDIPDIVTDALTHIAMRRLTREVTVTARLGNMNSARQIPIAVRGLAGRVYLASGRTAQLPVTHLAMLTRRLWWNGTDGQASREFLSFGRLPDESAGSYTARLDVLLTDGALFPPRDGLVYDVTDQVTVDNGKPYIVILLPDAGTNAIMLPESEGGITVDPWDDDEILLN